MKRPRRHPVVSGTHNGLVNVETAGLFGWLLARTSGLPRSGMISSRLEVRDGPSGERWTRHLRPGRANPAVTWIDSESGHELVEQLGPIRMHFTTNYDNNTTTVQLRQVWLARLKLPRRLADVCARAETAENGQLRTRVKMTLVAGKLGSLAYTSILLSE